MEKATLKISKLTDRKNGYGMPIVEVISDNDLHVVNRGYNEFEALNEIDETDLERLRTMPEMGMMATETVMLEIQTPSRLALCWYTLKDRYLNCTLATGSNLIF